MSVKQRNYNFTGPYCEDFHKIRDFIIRINGADMKYPCFDWSRWEWVHKDATFDNPDDIQRIGIWEENGEIVAVTTFESKIEDAYFLLDDNYTYLKEEMVEYAILNLSSKEPVNLMIDDTDLNLQKIAIKKGYIPTQDRETDSKFNISDNLSYKLPEGFSISSVADEMDLSKFHKVLWRGFNHKGEPPKDHEYRKLAISAPHQDLSLLIKTIAPNGDYASYCGMWYDNRTDYCIVEPVATDPSYRMMGCGKAAVLEGIKRCAELGAKYAYVGSSQQFYFNIGFFPVANGTYWKQKK